MTETMSGRNAAGGDRVVSMPWHTDVSARYRFTPELLPHLTGGGADGDPATIRARGTTMKPNIHPQYVTTEVTCSCGNSFTTRSTARNGVIHVETCNVCHPFYTGKQRVLDTAGRVAKFQQKYAKAQARKATGARKAGK